MIALKEKRVTGFDPPLASRDAALVGELALAGGESVLDIGCGDGRLTKAIAQRVPDGRVVGIDTSWPAVRSARRWEKQNLLFHRMDAGYINAESAFDLVFSNSTLQMIRDYRKLLTNVYRGLKPGGVIRFGFIANAADSAFVQIVRGVMAYESFCEYFQRFDWPWYMPTIGEYEKIVRSFPFRDVRVWESSDERRFTNPGEMVAWMDRSRLVPFLAAIPDDRERLRFHETVVEKMIQRTRQPDGSYVETIRRGNVYASK